MRLPLSLPGRWSVSLWALPSSFEDEGWGRLAPAYSRLPGDVLLHLWAPGAVCEAVWARPARPWLPGWHSVRRMGAWPAGGRSPGGARMVSVGPPSSLKKVLRRLVPLANTGQRGPLVREACARVAALGDLGQLSLALRVMSS